MRRGFPVYSSVAGAWAHNRAADASTQSTLRFTAPILSTAGIQRSVYNPDMPAPQKTRCHWATTPLSIAYHDREWGVPQHKDRVLFEFMILEGAQAGLSWETI